MRILGIDPGTTVTGFGLVDREAGALRHVAHGTLRLLRGASLELRLARLYAAVRELVELHEPDVAVVERVFVSASPAAAIVLGHARGAVLAALGAGGIGVSEYAPAQIKQAVTGDGRAVKPQVQRMVRRLLALERTPASDASDALAAAICHARAGRLVALGVARRRRRSAPRVLALRVGRPQ